MNAVADVRYLQPTQFDQIEPRFDAEFGVYWATMNPQPRPCFNPQLLLELRCFIDGIINSQATMFQNGHAHSVNYAVLASRTPGVLPTWAVTSRYPAAQSSIADRSQLEQYARLLRRRLVSLESQFRPAGYDDLAGTGQRPSVADSKRRSRAAC